MKKRLILYSSILIACLVIFITTFSFQQNESLYKEKVKEDLTNQGKLLDELLSDSQEDLNLSISKYSEDLKVRITLVDSTGVVIQDSEYAPRTMDNHGLRPEVKEAYQHGIGSSVRFSKTLKVDYLYVALQSSMPTLDGGVLRLAVPLSEIKRAGSDLMKVSLVVILAGTSIVVLLLYFLIRQYLSPLDQLTESAISISQGNYSIPVIVQGHEQVNRLAKAFENMRVDMKRHVFQLQDQKDELELILKSMVNGVLAMDADYQVMFSNEAFKTIFEIEEDIANKDIFHVLRLSKMYDFLDKVMKTGKSQQEQMTLSSKLKDVLVLGHPIIRQKTTVGCLLLVQDITKQNKLENMRRDFVSNVTHELKTPLTSIKGFVDTLRHGAINDEKVAHRFLEIIDIEAERLTNLINDILDLSEIENKEQETRQDINIASLIDDVMPILEEKAQKQGLSLEWQVDSQLQTFPCNAHRLKQLLINLVDNAIKYTEVGEIHVTVKKPWQDLIIEVKDTGIGMEESQLERIFERFYRIDKSRSRKIGGTGLGLSIVKHIVELYEGKIRVTSEMGKGSIFRVDIPYKK